ncbi:alpha-crystallin A chain-like [Temnothorax americanus]|uniref:alpha-crystallin A chain-like n=1 Tax=Temnothorax americanus TaxID=1964332 RepID=UPI0040696399
MGLFLLPLLYSQMHLVLGAPVSSLDRPENLTSRIDLVDSDNRRDIPDSPSWVYAALRLRHQLGISSTTGLEDNVFTINLSHVNIYKPEEVTVKIVNRWVIVEGKHEATKDGNDLSRQFVKQFPLPCSAEVDQIKATLSSNGRRLRITAPLKPKDERVIKIERTGKPAVPPNDQKEAGESETVPAIERKSEDNEVIREEVTATQAQETGPKPEK